MKNRPPLIVHENIDKIKKDIADKLKKLDSNHKNTVKLTRSRNETKLIIHLKGNLEDTEPRLQAIYQGLINYK